ncbi:MAG: serine protease Do [Candidatus Binatota bacterium]|jgi:serine protease Do|nr:serine protease Do [Candidatus Binatota bacterium]
MVTRKELYTALTMVAIVGFVLGRLVAGSRTVDPLTLPPAEAQLLSSEPSTFAAVAKRARPSVVNVFTTQRVSVRPFAGPFGPGDPFEQFFRQFFPEVPLEQERQSLGSGFIIDSKGYVITNHHVVANADEIRIKLADARTFPAKLVGSDPRTDVALVKMEGSQLPVAAIGDSDKIKVGDWVLAIGNPFGLEATVTAGIISATERVIGAGPFDDFIQTDASINPGNSGGPLIDVEGRVIGVNSAIFSQSGGSIGIGFAIPINLANQIAAQLRTDRRVVRGWLGVSLQEVTPELAQSFGLAEARGAVIADLYRGGPAHRAGLRRGDVILEFAGRPVHDSRQLTRWVAETKIGDAVDLGIMRGGKQETVQVTVEEAPSAGRT